MTEPWNDSRLARLSAELDEELENIFSQVDEALALGGGGQDEALAAAPPEAPDLSALSAAPDDSLDEDGLMPAGLDLSVVNPGGEGPHPDGEGWLEPALLGEPEVAGAGPVLTPGAVRELSRIIEAAVERGVAAALAKWRP